MENQNNRTDRQKLVRETLDRHERLITAGAKTRVAYWLFAALALVAIAAFVIGGAN